MRANPKSTTEIEESMAQLLTPTYIEKRASNNSAAEAMVSLLKAAEIFENLDMFVAAEVVTKVLEKIAAPIVDFDLGNYVSDAVAKELSGPIANANKKLGGNYISVDVSPSSGPGGLHIGVIFRDQSSGNVSAYVRDYIDKFRHHVDTNIGPKYMKKYQGKIAKIYSLG